MRRSSTCVDDFRDHAGFVLRLSPKGGRPAWSALIIGAISIALLSTVAVAHDQP
jgi:hypothetical protein